MADVGAVTIPVSTVRLESDEGEFHRTIKISASDDNETWNAVGQGDIYRDPRAGTSLSAAFPVYGNRDAAAPQYDFTTVTTVADRARGYLVTLGPEVPTVPGADSIPWTESHPIVLWLALVLAVTGLR